MMIMKQRAKGVAMLLSAAIFFICFEVVLGRSVDPQPVTNSWKTMRNYQNAKSSFFPLSQSMAVAKMKPADSDLPANDTPEFYAQRVSDNDGLFGELDAILFRELNEPASLRVIDGVIYTSYT